MRLRLSPVATKKPPSVMYRRRLDGLSLESVCHCQKLVIRHYYFFLAVFFLAAFLGAAFLAAAFFADFFGAAFLAAAFLATFFLVAAFFFATFFSSAKRKQGKDP